MRLESLQSWRLGELVSKRPVGGTSAAYALSS